MTSVRPNRSAGILLHPTCLPGPFGIGDLGPAAYAWVDHPRPRPSRPGGRSCPLGPTGLRRLALPVLLRVRRQPQPAQPRAPGPRRPARHDDLGGRLVPGRPRRLRRGRAVQARRWCGGRGRTSSAAGPATCAGASRSSVGDTPAGSTTTPCSWPSRTPAGRAVARLAAGVLHRRDSPASNWPPAKSADDGRGLPLRPVPVLPPVGTPAPVRPRARASSSSATCRSSSPATRPTSGPTPQLFLLDERPPADASSPACRPTTSAGPASCGATRTTTGRRCAETGLRLVGRPARGDAASMVDLVRLDHFRGFEAAWEVPAGKTTAERRRSGCTGPGRTCSRRLRTELGGPAADRRGPGRDHAGGGRPARRSSACRACGSCSSRSTSRTNPFLPHNYGATAWSTPGTHDNDTTRGWYATAPETESDYRPPLHRPGRRRRRLGPDPPGVGDRRRLRHRPAAGRARPGDRGADELARDGRRELALTGIGRRGLQRPRLEPAPGADRGLRPGLRPEQKATTNYTNKDRRQ